MVSVMVSTVTLLACIFIIVLPSCDSMFNMQREHKTFRRRHCKKLPHMTFNGEDPIREEREKGQVLLISLVSARNVQSLRYQLKCLNVLATYYTLVEQSRVKILALNDPKTSHLYHVTPRDLMSRVKFLNHLDQRHLFRRLGNLWDAIVVDPCGRITFHYFYPKNSLRFRFVSDAIHSTLHYGDQICGTCHRKRSGHLAKQMVTKIPQQQPINGTTRNLSTTSAPVKIIINQDIPIMVEEGDTPQTNRRSERTNRQREVLIPNKEIWDYPLAQVVDDVQVEQSTTPPLLTASTTTTTAPSTTTPGTETTTTSATTTTTTTAFPREVLSNEIMYDSEEDMLGENADTKSKSESQEDDDDENEISSDPIVKSLTNTIEHIWKEKDNSKIKEQGDPSHSKTSRKSSRRAKKHRKTSTKKRKERTNYISIYPKRNTIEERTARNHEKKRNDQTWNENYNGRSRSTNNDDDGGGGGGTGGSYKGGRLGSPADYVDVEGPRQQDSWVNKFVHDYILASYLGNDF